MMRLLRRFSFYGDALALPRPFVCRRRDLRLVEIGLLAPHGELLVALTFDLGRTR